MNLMSEMENPSITHDHMYGNKAVGMVSIVKVNASANTTAASLKRTIGSGDRPKKNVKKDPQTPAVCPKCGTNCHSHAGQLSTKKVLHKCSNCDGYFCQNAKSKVGKRKGKTKALGFYSVKFKAIDAGVKVDSSYQCLLCNKMFRSLSERNVHMVTHVGVDTHMCTLCGFVSHEKSAVEAHMVTHSVASSYDCPLCSKAFRTCTEMDRHLAETRHLGDTLGRCTQCSFVSTVKRQVMTVSIVQAEAERHAETEEITQDINIRITYSSRINQPATVLATNKQNHEGGSCRLDLSSSPAPPRSETKIKVMTKNQSNGGRSSLLRLSNAPKPPRSTTEEPGALLSKGLVYMCQDCKPPILFSTDSAFQAHLLTHTLGKDHIQGHGKGKAQSSRLETKIKVETNNLSVIDDADAQVPDNGSGDDAHSDGYGESPTGEPDDTEAHSILAAGSEQPEVKLGNNIFYMCKECKPPLLFPKESAFQAHLRTHMLGKEHIQGHAGGNTQPSNVCTPTGDRGKNSHKPTTTNTIENLAKHTVAEKELPEKVTESHGAIRYKCTLCGEEFGSEGWFRRHRCVGKRCVFCERTFSSSGELGTHMLTHMVGKKYRCTRCGEWFTNLPAHMPTHAGEPEGRGKPTYTEADTMQQDAMDKPDESIMSEKGDESEKPHKCSVCGKGFKTRVVLMGHMKLHNVRPYVCPLCAKRFPTWNILKIHMQSHTLKGPFQGTIGRWVITCVFCETKFSTSGELDTHMLTHTVGNQYMCTICCKWFSDLPAHMPMHAGETKPDSGPPSEKGNTESGRPYKYKCPLCGKWFRRWDHLKRHTRRHTGEKPYQCSHCGKQFSMAEGLNHHITTYHTGDEKPYQCDQCGKQWKTELHLSRHLKMHSGEKAYPCSQCDKRFRRQYVLNEHIKYAHGEGKHSCSYCGKRCLNRTSLRDHEAVHTGNARFQCSECGKRFIRKKSLTTHMLRHTGERPHMCHVCGKTFYTAESLKTHQAIHSAEKPYECSECGKGFLRLSLIKAHMRTHTGEKPFGCAECGRAYSTKNVLKLHSCIQKRRGRKKRKPEYEELMAAAATVSSLNQPFIPDYMRGAPEPSSFVSVEVASGV